jgi:tetratricopeptide (TPR) repeat protein
MPRDAKQSSLFSGLHVPLLIAGAFLLGAGGMWVIMRTSSSSGGPPGPPMQRVAPIANTTAPDVSQLAPADAARTLGDWYYDQRNFPLALQQYQDAIRRGTDNPDVRTDLGNCYRFLGQPQKALEQYETAQKQDPQHENSLFNQAGLFAEVLHNPQRALTAAREFLRRFPQSEKAAAARELIAHLEQPGHDLP